MQEKKWEKRQSSGKRRVRLDIRYIENKGRNHWNVEKNI